MAIRKPTKQDADEWKALSKEFTEFWEAHGRPDPISNDYIALTRAFYYGQGMKKATEISSELSNIVEEAGQEGIMEHLLYLYDWHIRTIDASRDDYSCGYTDAIGQVILDLGDKFGETHGAPYKFEAYKRVYTEESVEQYKRDYPKPIKRPE